jgi:hypothetical protein
MKTQSVGTSDSSGSKEVRTASCGPHADEVNTELLAFIKR